MVNNDRIVPIMKIDFLSMIGTVMTLNSTSYGLLAAKDVDGNFDVTGSGAVGNKLANQPVKSLDFKSGVTSGTVYFVAAYDFEGLKVAGASATYDDSYLDADDMKKDGITLYKAVLGSGTITLTAVTPSLS